MSRQFCFPASLIHICQPWLSLAPGVFLQHDQGREEKPAVPDDRDHHFDFEGELNLNLEKVSARWRTCKKPARCPADSASCPGRLGVVIMSITFLKYQSLVLSIRTWVGYRGGRRMGRGREVGKILSLDPSPPLPPGEHCFLKVGNTNIDKWDLFEKELWYYAFKCHMCRFRKKKVEIS